MRRVHATSREQLAELPVHHGWFDLEDVAFDAESGCVVVPFRVLDESVAVEAPPGLIRRLLRRSGDRYATWRRWFLRIHGAVDLEIEKGFPERRPCDFLEVDFDPEDSELTIYGDWSWDTVSARVERVDVVVEETPEHLGWGLVYPRVGDLILGGDGVILPTPPPGSRAIAMPFVLYACRECGAWNLRPAEIVHLSERCEGRSDFSHIDRVTAKGVRRETL